MLVRQIARWLNRLLGLVGLRIVRARAPEVPQVLFWDLGDNVGVVRTHARDLIFIDVRDESVGAPVRRHGEWEPHITQTMQRLLLPGGAAVEVGSNIGCHVVTMARSVGPTGSVMAIEANPDVADLLRCTVAINRLRNVRIVEQAVLDSPRDVELWASPSNLGGGAVAIAGWENDPNVTGWHHHSTKATTLDALTEALPSVDLIHIDAEGCELAILVGAQQLLARSPQVKIIAEWGAYHAPSYFDIDKGLEFLIGCRFNFWQIAPDGTLLPQTKEQMLARDFCDVLMARGDPHLSMAD